MFHRFDHSQRIEGEKGSARERFGGYKLNPDPLLPTTFITSSFKFPIRSKISRSVSKGGQREK
jgi:hypothetical protein